MLPLLSRLSLTLTLFTPLAAAQAELYFCEYQFGGATVSAMGLDGSNPHTLFALPSNEWLPVGLSVEPTTQKLYIAEMSAPENILRCNLDGSALQSVAAATSSTRAVRFDGLGRMYWSEGNRAWRANLDGSAPQLLFTASETWPMSAIAVDGTNGHVYFGADGDLQRINLDGSNRVKILGGTSSVRDVEIDIAAGHIYWLDVDTISGFVGRARLDGSEFTVLYDASPAVVQSSGLIALLVDRVGRKLYIVDDLADTIVRTELDGSSASVIYSTTSGPSPSGLCLSVPNPPQPVADCNGNGIADGLDLANGTSFDCNANGYLDECELAACPAQAVLLDQPSNPNVPSLTVGGPNPSVQFEVLAPFDVPAGGWDLGELELDGFTANFGLGGGFTVTLFPDAAGMPNESQPLASVVMNLRFDPDRVAWVNGRLDVDLPAGRHWLRLASNEFGVYHSGANVSSTGLGSISRRADGTLFANSPLALRLIAGEPRPRAYCTPKLSSNHCLAALTASGTPTASGSFTLRATQVEGQRSGLFFVGFNGAVAAPFQGGTLCVVPPLMRFPAQTSGGTSGTCSGTLAQSVAPLVASSPVGTSFWSQAWFRDPGSPSFTGLSSALEFTSRP